MFINSKYNSFFYVSHDVNVERIEHMCKCVFWRTLRLKLLAQERFTLNNAINTWNLIVKDFHSEGSNRHVHKATKMQSLQRQLIVAVLWVILQKTRSLVDKKKKNWLTQSFIGHGDVIFSSMALTKRQTNIIYYYSNMLALTTSLQLFEIPKAASDTCSHIYWLVSWKFRYFFLFTVWCHTSICTPYMQDKLCQQAT